MSIPVRRTILKLLIEYFLLTFPILIYVSIEALHHQDAIYLFRSPEWSIATIFVLLQTYRLYSEEMNSVLGHRLGEALVVLLVVFAVAAAINIYLTMGSEHPSWSLLLSKWGLLAIATVLFVYVGGAAIYSAEDEQ